jgi:hypothetical protein
MADNCVHLRKLAPDAKIRSAQYKLHNDHGKRCASSRTTVRLRDGAGLLT